MNSNRFIDILYHLKSEILSMERDFANLCESLDAVGMGNVSTRIWRRQEIISAAVSELEKTWNDDLNNQVREQEKSVGNLLLLLLDKA